MFGRAGIAGSLIGSAVDRHIDPNLLLLLLFSGLILLAAWRMLVGCPSCTEAGDTAALAAIPRRDTGRVAVLVGASVDLRRYAEVLAAGTATGFTTGLFGVGEGWRGRRSRCGGSRRTAGRRRSPRRRGRRRDRRG